MQFVASKPQKMNLLSSTFFLFFMLTCIQQNIYGQINSLKATITDKTGSPITGNLLLTDSIGMILRTTAFNGDIDITGLNHSYLKLKMSSLFFADTTFTIRFHKNKNINLGKVIPDENTNALGQVNIIGAVPLIRYGNNGSMEVNVAGTILASSSSVNEILSRTPGITINEGIISLQGKGEAIIYLNGVLVPLERLASIPTSQITKIELISNPSVRYDAAGRAVINITTKVPNGNGVTGRLAQHLTYSEFFGTNANTFADLAYSKSKISFSSNIALLKGNGRELLYTTRVRKEAYDYLNSQLTTDWNRNFKLYATYGIGMRYNFSAKSNLGISLSGNRDALGGSVNSENRIQTSATTNLYGSNIAKDELRNNNNLDADFSTITDTLGSSYFISGQYAKYNTDYDDGIAEFGGINPRYLRNQFAQDMHITSLQAERTKAFDKISKLEAGVRFSSVGNSSYNQFAASDKQIGLYVIEETLSSSFSYEENIWGAYTSFSTRMGKLQINIGARGEWTNYSLFTTAGNGQDFKKSYFNIFPNLQMELPINQYNKISASYSSRITRPRYQALNPFVVYQDPFTTIEGNPALLPERAHAFELSANLKKTALKLAYTYTTDQLTAAALRGKTPESYVLKSINISTDKSFLLSLTRPFSIGNWWQSINTASLSYAKSFDDQYGFAIGKSRPQVYLYTSNTFTLKRGIRLQLLTWFFGDRYYSLGHNEKRSIVTAGIEKSLLSNNLKIGFTANDIFNRTAFVGDYNVGNTQINYNRGSGNNYFKLTANYRFGGSERPILQNNKPLQPENNRAN